jgi:ubiquinone/menaquinone biosynthesis C-methylase UbiE
MNMTASSITPPVDSVDDVRKQLQRMWGSVAGGWEAHADYADARGADTATAMLEAAAVRSGDRVLELACGPAGLGLEAAARVGSEGEVVLSDVAPEMTAIAAARARRLGLSNISTRVLDLEQIAEPDNAYDVVLCREGLMLVPDPVRAAREICRVLRPGGRTAIAVWGPRERNPWLGVVFDAVSAQTGAPVPPPGVPGPFSLDDAGRLESVLVEAGLEAVDVRERAVPCRAASAGEWWERTCALAGPLAQRLAALPEPVAKALAARAQEAIGVYETPAGLEIPGVTLIATAVKR